MFWKVPAGDNRAPVAGVGHADAAGEPRRSWADVLTRARPGAPWPRSRSARGPSPQTQDSPTSEAAFPGTGVQGEGRPGARGSFGVGVQAPGPRGASKLRSEPRTAHRAALRVVRPVAQELHPHF